jgi:hypothetical protein
MPDAPKNFFAGNKFKFSMTSSRFKGNEFDIRIAGANLPGLNLGLVTRGTHVRTLELPGDSITFDDLTIEFILSEDLEEYMEIWQWIYDLRNFDDSKFDNEIFADATLVLLTNKNNPNIGFKITDLFPYVLSEIPLSHNTVEGEAITATATFKFIGLERIDNI